MTVHTNTARMVRVIDGDTVEVAVLSNVDLGFYFKYAAEFPVTLRLSGIDTPEIRGKSKAKGLEVKAWLEEKLPVGAIFRVDSLPGPDKYGRWLGILYTGTSEASINDQMIELGLAKPYDGGKKP